MGDDMLVDMREAARAESTGPGRLGRDGVAGAMLWDAGIGIDQMDLLDAFWRDEAGAIDWLTGVLCDGEMTALFARLAAPEEEAETEVEELYSKASMTTLGSDSIDTF